MTLSDNIKRLRIERGMTQEQLASALSISPQAVSKWETSDTYPDGALLLPLANALGASLDELFGNKRVSMSDVSGKIISLIYNTAPEERFAVAHDVAWQIQRGLFNCKAAIDTRYDPNDLKDRTYSSFIMDDFGFTLVSNGKEPFFSIFSEPEEGFGNFLNSADELQGIFAALSHSETMKAIACLYQKSKYAFESSVLAKECEIADDRIDAVMEDLLSLCVVTKQELKINGEDKTIYRLSPRCEIIALFLLAQELRYKGGYCLTGRQRKKPLLKKDNCNALDFRRNKTL